MLKGLASIVVVVLLFSGGYIYYRYWNAHRFEAGVSLLGPWKGIPPFQCVTDAQSFGGTSQMIASMADGMFFMATHQNTPKGLQEYYVFVDKAGNFYFWNKNGLGTYTPVPDHRITETKPLDLPIELTTPTDSKTTCVPWWRPDLSIFLVPGNVKFTTVEVK